MQCDTGKKIYPRSGCLLCGKPLRYEEKSRRRICAVCGENFESNAVCEDGHFVCDRCHSGSFAPLFGLCRGTKEKNPVRLFKEAVKLPGVHLHGPEHHAIVPCVLLTAYCNNGGSLDLEEALQEAVRRGRQVPGGFCGFWGACGAAVGAGIYASIVMGSGPVNGEKWPLPQRLTARCLERIAETGGPRCCKRTARLAMETTARFTEEEFGISMETKDSPCGFFRENKECLGEKCPYYPVSRISEDELS